MAKYQTHHIGVIGAYQQRFVIMHLFNLLVDKNEAKRPISTHVVPYARLTTETQETIQLFGFHGLRAIDLFHAELPTMKFLILVDSKTPEAFREVKSIIETLRALNLSFAIITHPADHPDSWQEHEIREALQLDAGESLWMTKLDTQEDMLTAIRYTFAS